MNAPISTVGQASRRSLTSRAAGDRRDACPTRWLWRRAQALAALLLLTLSPLRAPGAETSATAYPIDLATALRLAGAQNLDVQLARGKVTQAQANHPIQAELDLTRAREACLSAVADFDKAQYGLQRAVGEPDKTP